jgi:GT2 family glycosyltransferase
MNISIIIPNYNGAQIMQKNLPKVFEAIKTYKHGKIELIICDDPSTDNSLEVIRHFITSIKDSHITAKLIENKNRKEAGFSSNVNRGCAAADQKSDLFILLNTDVVPHNGFIDDLNGYFDDEKVFGVGFMDESVEGNEIHYRGRGIGKWKRGFFVHGAGDIENNHTLWISGGSGAFRSSLWNKFHGLDVLYNPFYWEDIDLSYRALKSGYKILFAKQIVVRHEHDQGTIRTKFTAKKIKEIAYRNQFIFIWKNITQKRFLISHFFWLPYHILNAIKSKDWALLRGLYAALMRLTDIRNSGETAKKYFVRSDKAILKENAA